MDGLGALEQFAAGLAERETRRDCVELAEQSEIDAGNEGEE